jgi:hypothetical protein
MSTVSNRKRASRRPSAVEDEVQQEIDNMVQHILDDDPIDSVSKDLVDPVIARLQEHRNTAIADGEYMAAADIEDRMNNFILIANKVSYEDDQDITYQELRAHYDQAQSDLRTAIRARRHCLREIERQREHELSQMRETHARELAEFDKRHNCPPPNFFRRWSPEYLNLRYQEKFLVRSKRYVEAHAIKCEADTRKSRELQQMEDTWSSASANSRLQLTKHHEHQIQGLEESFLEERIAKAAEHDLIIQGHDKTVKKAEQRIKDAESYNSPRTRLTIPGQILRIRERDLPPRVTKIRCSNYQMRRDELSGTTGWVSPRARSSLL